MSEQTAVLPALRVPASLKAELEVEARAAGCSVSDLRRAVLAGRHHQVATVPRANPSTTPTKAASRARDTVPARCACPRPRPKATSFGVCTSCRKPR